MFENPQPVAGLGPANQSGTISAELARLHDALAVAEKMIVDFIDHIEPVLAPDTPTQAPKGPEVTREQLAPMAEDIRGCSGRIESICLLVGRTADRIRL